jgi:hypothetical protein
MRASSLSNRKIIDLINAYFVPAYLSNEDVLRNPDAQPALKQELLRIRTETSQAKMSSGTVHVYLLDSEGHPVGSQHVAVASKVEELTALLEKTIARLKVPAGPTLVPPSSQSTTPRAGAGAVVLHIVARNVSRQNGEDRPHKPVLGVTRSGNWGAYPVEDWIVLPKTEWARLLPKGAIALGQTWEVDRDVAAKVLRHFYPSTENNDVAKNRIDRQELKATVVSVKEGIARARLNGRLRMKHPFYHRDDDKFVEATLLGFLDFEVRTGRLVTWQLVTTDATYGRSRFGVAAGTVVTRD